MKEIPLLGAHVSIAGGLEKALMRGHELGCTAVQIFTKNANRWKERHVDDEEIGRFEATKKETGLRCVISHSSYLINLASHNRDFYGKSIEAMVNEVRRCDALGITCIVLHPGSHRGWGERVGVRTIAAALNEVHAQTERRRGMIALETTAGQGTAVGYRLEQIARIMDKVHDASRIALCLDTCHVFAAGYDFRTDETYEKLLHDIDAVIGMDKLAVIHVNDSKTPCGSRVDQTAMKISERGSSERNPSDGLWRMNGFDIFRKSSRRRDWGRIWREIAKT